MSVFELAFLGYGIYISILDWLSPMKRVERGDAEMQRLSCILTTLDSASPRLPAFLGYGIYISIQDWLSPMKRIERRDAEMQRLSYILTTLYSATLRSETIIGDSQFLRGLCIPNTPNLGQVSLRFLLLPNSKKPTFIEISSRLIF